VANVFTNGRTNAPSMLILRILGLLHDFDSMSTKRSVGNLIAVLEVIGGWTQREILEALNYLMVDRRPLVWVDGRSKFSLAGDASVPAAREILFLTSAGKRYLKGLVMELSYFQEAMFGLDWQSELVPRSFEMDDINVRFRALRACFKQLQVMDQMDVKRFKESAVVVDALTPTLVTGRILYGVGRAAFLIFESQRLTRGVAAEELLEWRDLIVQSFNLEYELLQRNNDRLASLLRDFDRVASAYG
jgi:hypothetical protein